MKDTSAPIAAPPPSRAVTSLEASLEHCCDTVRQSLELAHGIDPHEDAPGQDKAFARALEFMKVSARAGLALAKVKSEFTANFNVTRRTIQPGPDPALEEARRAGDAKFWAKWHETFAREEARADEAEEACDGEGVPPSNFRGSNAPEP
jgi:hypothetical protein